MANPKDTYTIEQFIEAGTGNPITYSKLSMIEYYNEIKFPIFNVIQDYMEEMKLATVTVTLNDKEHIKYMYKPKLLAYDIYGNPELYFIILALNNMCSVKDFDIKKIKLLKTEILNEFITYIYNAEKKAIEIYNSAMEEKQLEE